MRNNITIIIPTTNYRGNLVQRALSYYRLYNLDVIVVDNSNKSQKFKLRKNEKYFHLPKMEFIKRIIFAIKKTRNKYVCVCQDDDFLVFTSLLKAQKYLDKNKNCALAFGKDLYFEKKFRSYYFTKMHNVYLEDIKNPNKIFNRFSSILKLKKQMTSSLFKRIFLLKSLNLFEKQELNLNHKKRYFDEFAFSLFPINFGNFKYLNLIWQIKDTNVYPYTMKKNLTSISRPLEKLNKSQYLKLKGTNKLRDYLFKTINKNTKDKISFDYFNSIFNKLIFEENTNQKIIYLENIKNFIKYKIPFIFRLLKKINYIFRLLFFLKKKNYDKFKISKSGKDLIFIINNFENLTDKIKLN